MPSRGLFLTYSTVASDAPWPWPPQTIITGQQPVTPRPATHRRPASITLKEMYQFGDSVNQSKRTLLLAAQFLHEELPVRLARRARELKKLPFGLSETASIKVRRLAPRGARTSTIHLFSKILQDTVRRYGVAGY